MLNNEFPPLGGGTGTVNRALLQHFAQVPELSIDLVTSALRKHTQCEQFAERIQIHKVPVNNQNLHHSSGRELISYAVRALPYALKLHRRQPYDLCLAFSAVPAGGMALMLRWLTKLPYLLRVCGPDIPGFEQRYAALYPVLAPIIRATWRGAETVVAKCQGEADMVRRVDPSMSPYLIPNGVDLDSFRPGSPVADTGPIRLLCVARLIERKGQQHLIEAVSQLIGQGLPLRLDLIGTGDAQAANMSLVQERGLQDHVHFSGYVPREAIAAEYAAAHIFVLPSFNEGMSVATLEAMAAGLPVIVTRTGGTLELVEEGGTGLTFDWADIETLTAHIRRLVTDRALIRQMGMASRTRAARFAWETAAARYVKLFEQGCRQSVPQDMQGTQSTHVLQNVALHSETQSLRA